MSYFGYVERAADSYVNWADVGRSLTGTIDAIDQARTEKKALIEKAYREDLDYIMASPSGEQKELGEWSLKFGNTAAENLKLQYNLLKAGKIKVDDFVSFRENLTSDTEKLYSTLSEIQKNFGEAMERYKKGDSQVLEQVIMQQIEQYGKLSDTESYVNGLNGHIAIGLTEEVEENGQKVRRLSKDPNKYITISNLKAASLSRYDNYNPDADLQKFADANGTVEVSIMQLSNKIGMAGSIIDVVNTDAEILKERMERYGMDKADIAMAEKMIQDYKASKEAYFETMLAPFNELAMLTNQIKFTPDKKSQYTITFNPEDLKKGPEYVLVERGKNGELIPKPTEEQKKHVRQVLDDLLYSKSDRKVTGKEASRYTPPASKGFDKDAYNAGKEKTELQRMGEIISYSVSGITPGDAQMSMEYINQLKGISRAYYDPETGTLVAIPEDPNKKTITNKIFNINPDTGEATPYRGVGYMDNVQWTRAFAPILGVDPIELTATTNRQEASSVDRPLDEFIAQLEAEMEAEFEAFQKDPRYNFLDKQEKIRELRKRTDAAIEKEKKRRGITGSGKMGKY